MGPEPPARHDGVEDAVDPATDALVLRMLGPLEAWRGGRRLALGGQRQRSVLACLMLDPGHDVSADRIIDAIWGEHPPSGIATTLQTYVFHLREVLEPTRAKGVPASVVVTVAGGYRLDASNATIDAQHFEDLVRSGRAALAENPQTAASRLSEALTLWRGDVLADLESLNGLVTPVAARLACVRSSATEAWVAAELALGHHDTVLPTLEDLVERHPLREHLATLRMLALYRAGRQADALDAYRRLRRTLDEELGIRPSVEVEAIHQQVLRQDPALTLPPPTARTQTSGTAEVGVVAEPGDAHAGSAESTRSRQRPRGALAGLSRRGVAAIVAIVVLAGAALVASTSLLRRGDIVLLPANSVGPIGAAGLRGDAVQLEGAPSALTSAGGAVWAVLENTDAVVKIDPKSRTVVDTVRGVGGSPRALAASGDDLWVTGAEDKVLTRINVVTRTIVQKIQVGVEPAAVVAGPDGVWVANSGDNTIQRVNPASEKADAPIPVGDGPAALALDGTILWVANARAATLSQIDTTNGRRAASDIPVDAGPASLAITPTDVWVANEYAQTVSRVSRSSGKVQRIEVADGPSSLVVHDGQVWVTNRFGRSVSRIDVDSNVVHEADLGSAPMAVAVVDGEVWAGAGAYDNGEHRGGTLVWTGPGFDYDTLDPAISTLPMYVNLSRLAYDGLVAQRLTGGRTSLLMVADLAASVPEPSDGGRTYVFAIRRDIHYSTGAVVQPSDFVRGIERALRPDSDVGVNFEGIVDAASCMKAEPAGCDLRRGVVPDDANSRLFIHLSEPDPEFLFKLTNSIYPRPVGFSVGQELVTPLPSTGPYQIASVDHGSVTLTRNPYFEQWSAAAQPQGYPDVIAYRRNVSEQAGLADVVAGRAHGTYANEALPPSVTSRPGMAQTYNQLQVQYLFPNTTQAPFDDERVRRALSYAVDRRRIAEIASANPACQMVPPSFPGFRPYCPHQSGPASGAYQGPDLAKARALVADSGTAGTPITVQHGRFEFLRRIAQYTASVLTDLGYRVDVRQVPDDVGDSSDPYFDTVQIMVPLGWLADYPSPGTFYSYVGTCTQKKFNRFCGAEVEAKAAQARALTRTDPIGALEAWAKVDQMLIDTAAVIPTDAQVGTVVVSPQVGNVLLRPINGPILDQMWVR